MRLSANALNAVQNNSESNTAAFTPTRLHFTDNQQTTPTIDQPQTQNISPLPFNQESPTMQDSTPEAPTQINNDTTTDQQNQDDSQYEMSIDHSSTRSADSTELLLQRIDDLTETLQLERDNNAILMSTLEEQQNNTANQPNTDQQINDLRQQINELKNQATPTSTPTVNNEILEVIKQQQILMSRHMSENTSILQKFGESIQSLQEATLKSAKAAEKQAQEAIESRQKKGPQSSKLP
jgi:hypothetical protein